MGLFVAALGVAAYFLWLWSDPRNRSAESPADQVLGVAAVIAAVAAAIAAAVITPP